MSLRLRQQFFLTVSQPGSETQITLSLAEFPFPCATPGKVIAITAQGASEYPSVSFDSKTCTVSYSTAPVDGESLVLNVVYDPQQ